MNESLTSLKVEDAYTRDIGKGVMRIDYDSMDSIKARVGDIIEIKGARKTLVVCLPLYPSDDGKGILRADNLVQDNGIRKITKVITKNVTVLPLDPIPPGTERYLKDALDGVPVIKGDKIAAPYFGKSLLFQVVKATPAGVVSNQKTKFSIAKS